MLAIFNKGLVNPPKELHCPNLEANSNNKVAKNPEEICRIFQQTYSQNAPLSLGFGNSAFLGYSPSPALPLHQQRIFCAMDNMYCIFLGHLNNLNTLIRQYGLGKTTNEAMYVIEAYRTLRDRGPYPADQVIKDLEGCFGFVIYDRNAGTVFVAQGDDQRVQIYWGIAADGSVVVSDNKDVIKASCAKSFAPFPAGCMFHSEGGLMSYEHPRNKLKAMPRIDSEGMMCGANFKVDVTSKKASMPRVGSEANWALSGSQA